MALALAALLLAACGHHRSPDDLAVSDLSVGDLSVGDQSVPDLASSDLAPRVDGGADDGGVDGATAMIPDPRGVYLVTTPQSMTDGTTTAALALTGVDGVLVDTAWNRIESDSGVWDFSEIDSEAQAAITAGGRFELAIRTGGSEPGYLFNTLDATQLALLFAPKAGATGCDTEIMAAPWDPTYLAALDDMLSRVSQHLKDAGLYPKLTMVRITTVNGQSDELRLPAQDASVATCLATSPPITAWSNAGYTPAKLLKAWNTGLASFSRYFPDKTFNVAIISGSLLPPIEDNGTIDTGAAAQTQETAQLANLLAAAAIALPGRLAIQWNGVSDQATNLDVTDDASSLHTIFGWQSDEWGGESGGAECGPDAADAIVCTHAAYQMLLDNALHPTADPNVRATYLELFAPNLIAYPGLAAYAHNQLFAP